MSIDTSTGPAVVIFINPLPPQTTKECVLSYGPNSTFEKNSTFTGKDVELSYQLPPLIAGATYNYKLTCSMVQNGRNEKLFTDTGSFPTGIGNTSLMFV